MNDITFNGVSFTVVAALRKSEQHYVDSGLRCAFPEVKANDRNRLLREAYAIICKVAGVEPKEAMKQPEELIPDTEKETTETEFSEHQSDEQPEEVKPSTKPKGRR